MVKLARCSGKSTASNGGRADGRHGPINEVFQRELGIDVVTIGFGLPGSKIHAPNEQYHVNQFELGQRIYGAYLKALVEN